MIGDICGELLWKWNDKHLLGDRDETRGRILELHRVFGTAAGGAAPEPGGVTGPA
ncbi:hypothetical protein [Streptomyces sp. NPDC020681]|uniref:hypothetical protein n=1 Tax=Streptomyces sp. NPDC020681 TaxID=3365083 RepID=UPI003788EC24